MKKTVAIRPSWFLGFAAMLSLALVFPLSAQTSKVLGGEPRDLMERYWATGVRGELLTRDGWDRASADFETKNPRPLDGSFDVLSNDYGVGAARVEDDTATVVVGVDDEGHIDANLRYSPPRPLPPGVLKTAILFRLKIAPVINVMYGPDGKTIVEKKDTGYKAWIIVGHQKKPWTTVNSAIRHVLEMRSKTTDPVVQKNADETLAKLLTLH